MFLEVSADLLSRGYSVRFRPGGHSMSPTIRDGEAVTVEPIEAERVRVRDIILYRAARSVIAHRVVRIERREETGALSPPGDVGDDSRCAGRGRPISVELSRSSVRVAQSLYMAAGPDWRIICRSLTS